MNPPQDPDTIVVKGLDGPGAPRNHSKRWGASFAPHPLELFLLPPGPSRPPKSMISGPWGGGVVFHDYVKMKLGVMRGTQAFW